MTSDRLRAALQLGVLALLVLAPLPFGSVQAGPMLAIELAAAVLGLGTILLIGRDEDARAAVPKLPLSICIGVIALGVFQLVPLPFSIAERFNPTAELVRPLIPHLGLGHAPGVSWSVATPETTDALLRFIAYTLIGLASAVAFDSEQSRRRFAVVLVSAALFQAVYGSGEYLTGRQHIFGFAKKYYRDSATGTFINRNHFATLLAMALPFALALATDGRDGRRWRGWRDRIVDISDGRTSIRLFAVVAAATVWMGLLLSHSRAGLLAGVAGAGIVLLHFRQMRATRWALSIGIGVLLLLLSLELTHAPGERFFEVKDDLGAKAGRLAVWRDSTSLVSQRPVLGWGFGTFETAFKTVQSADINVNYDHAHSDWVEWTVEGGGFALLAAVALLLVSLRLGVAATQGALLAVALHGVWDFPLRIPAVAVVTSATVGLAYAASTAVTAARAKTDHVRWGDLR